MGNWGDDTDFEVKALKDYEGRFTINFKKIFNDVDEISQKTLEVTDTHPKDSLLKLWAGTMTGMFIFFLLSYQAFALMLIPILAFYLIALVRVGRCWKSFRYSSAQFWLMSAGTIVVLLVISQVLQRFLINIIF